MAEVIFLNTRGEIRDFNTGNVKSYIKKPEHVAVQSYQAPQEYFNSLSFQKEFVNSLGGEQNITTLTSILADIIDQSYYTINVSDYVPIVTGEGNPWSYSLMQWKRSINRNDIGNRLANLASNASQINSNNVSVEPFTRPVINWVDGISYNIFQEKTFTSATQRMDYIAELYQGRKEIWDLDVQEVSMYGCAEAGLEGLLTQSAVNINTTLITKKLSDMTATEFNAFGVAIVEAYRANCFRTAYPDTLIIPEDDFIALGKQASETYQNRIRLDVLEEVLQKTTGNKNFKILSLSYAMQSYNSAITGLNKDRYVLTRQNKNSLRMDIPLNFTVTLPNSLDNMTYNSAAYGRFTGVTAIKELETLYFDLTPAST